MKDTMQIARTSDRPRWRRRLDVTLLRAARFVPYFEVIVLGAAIAIGLFTYGLVTGSGSTKALAPATMALLLIANLIPAVSILMLIGRRIARDRARRSPIGGRGTLHVRLVAYFSLIAAVPMLFMVIFASLLFQYGVEVWYTDRARSMFQNTATLSREFYADKQGRVMDETEAMAIDVGGLLAEAPIDSALFKNQLFFQLYQRELSEGAVLAITKGNGVQTMAFITPYKRPTAQWVPDSVAQRLLQDRKTVFVDTGRRMEAITPLPNSRDLFLYASRVADNETVAKAQRASAVLRDYDALISQSRKLQLRFNVALYLLTLMIVGTAVLIALGVADRLVRPVGDLVAAARRVAGGDLSVRVPGRKTRDEVGMLTNAFNRMTGRLSQQTQELVHTNELLDRRRALTEAVLSGVSAGVIAVDEKSNIRLLNNSACELLSAKREEAVGTSLKDLVPEFDTLLETGEAEGLLEVIRGQDVRTFAVRIVKDEIGRVLTFDDITQQQLDQRRAAWSDVARRVAHEIKNPLTPIQLAAERLKRRFSKEIESDPAAFEKLTDTISRQVGDLRRMVDEFSSFARMPKPVFAEESVVDVVREALFLHEVANPGISFQFNAPDPAPQLVCDRRQLAQAISNVIKNGVEAIQGKFGENETILGKIDVGVISTRRKLEINISDTGIGLPVERDRIIEPYMTTRAGGTGLGLAIVMKIAEEHLGKMSFSDRKGGGTVVTFTFDPAKLQAAHRDAAEKGRDAPDRPSELTRKEQVNHVA